MPADHTFRDGGGQLGRKYRRSMIVHDDRILCGRHHCLALGNHHHIEGIVVGQTVLRQFRGPHLDRVVVVLIELVVGKVIDVVEREQGGFVAVQRVGEVLRDSSTAIHRIVQLDGRHNVSGTVVGDLQGQMLVAEVAIGDGVHQFQHGDIIHKRGIHHRTKHETTGELRNIRTVAQIEECGIAKRGLNLGTQIVTVGEHLQAHIELARGVRQREVVNRNLVPSTLLQRAEIHHLGSGQDIAVGIGHESLEAVLGIRDIGLVVVVFHRPHGQFLVGLVAHARTDNVVIVTNQLDEGGGVGDIGNRRVGHHTPVLGVVDIVLVVGAAHLHVLDLSHAVLMVREGDDGLGVGGQRRNRNRIMPLLGSTGHGQIDLNVGLRLRAIVAHQGTHHVAHLVARRGLASSVNFAHRDVVRIEATHADTVDVEVVTVLGGSIKSDIDTVTRGVVGKVIPVALPSGSGGRLFVTFDGSGGLALRGQRGISDTIVGGNLHRHLIILVRSSIVVGEPQLENRVVGTSENRHRQYGARNRIGCKALGIEEHPTDTIDGHDGRVHTFAVLERPVTSTADLLNRPSLPCSVAEILLIVGDNVLQREVLAQSVIGVLAVTGIVDDDGEINRQVGRNDHAGGQHLVHRVQRSQRASVHRHRLIEVQGSGLQQDSGGSGSEVDRGTTLVGDFHRNIVGSLGTFTQRGAHDRGKLQVVGGDNVRVCTHIGELGTVDVANILQHGRLTPALQARHRVGKQALILISDGRHNGDVVGQGGDGVLQFGNRTAGHRLESDHTGTGIEVVVATRCRNTAVEIQRIVRVVRVDGFVQ